MSRLASPLARASRTHEQISTMASSPSPRSTASNMGETGSQFHTDGPPATTMGSSCARSSARMGMRERSSASTMFVQAISCASVKPTTSKDAMGEELSSASSGTSLARMRSAMSTHGR